MVQTLDFRGMARCDLNDFGGLDDLRRALQIAHEIETGNDAALLYLSLAERLWVADGPATALETCRTGIVFAEQRGLVQATTGLRCTSLPMLADVGRWEEVIALADDVIVSDRAHGGRYDRVGAEIQKAFVWLWRGEASRALPLIAELLPQAQDIDDLQILVPALAAAAVSEWTKGAPRLALDHLQELDRVTHERSGGQWYLGLYLADLVRACTAAQEHILAARLIEHAPAQATRHQHARLTAQAVLTETRTTWTMPRRCMRRWLSDGRDWARTRARSGPTQRRTVPASTRSAPSTVVTDGGSHGPRQPWRSTTLG
jgi:hypothetical protein